MDIVIHEAGKTFSSKDADFDYSLWYVYIKDAYEKFSPEQIKLIEDAGGYVELSLGVNSHYSKQQYFLRNVPEKDHAALQAVLDK